MTGNRLERKVLRDDVYDVILTMLLEGHFQPGAALGIDALSRELGVSPTPIREALVQLEHTGLVSRAALRGYRVAPPISQEQMLELIEARAVVELAAVQMAYPHRDEFLPDLRLVHARHEESMSVLAGKSSAALSPGVLKEYFDADWQFHVRIMKASGNRYLFRMLEPLGGHVHRVRQIMGQGELDAGFAVEEHALILRAFEQGSKADVMRAMESHLHGVRTRSEGVAR